MNPRRPVPLPLPDYVEEQLKVGLRSIELHRDIWEELRTAGFEGPWLSERLKERLLKMIEEADDAGIPRE